MLPMGSTVFLSLADSDKPAVWWWRGVSKLGLGIAATKGTAAHLRRFGMHVDQEVGKVQDHDAVTAVDLIADGKISFVVNTPQGVVVAPTANRSARPPACTE